MSAPQPLSYDDLAERVATLDLETKVRLLSGAGPWALQPVPEIGLRAVTVSDGPVGVRGGTDTELDPSAAFPSGSAMAATWDEDLLHRIGAALAREAVRKGVDVVLGPTINLHRSPLGGRHFECMSEDPLLSGRLATAYVRGVQEQGIGACPKHYVANDAETDRFTVDNRVDERTLRELYLAPFEAVVADAAPWMVMAAYNGVNGTSMTEHDLLDEPLKGEWGFDGVVVSDWGAVHDGEPAARAALDLAMPGPWRAVDRAAGRRRPGGQGAGGGDRRQAAQAAAPRCPVRGTRRGPPGDDEARRRTDRGRVPRGQGGRLGGGGAAAQRRPPAAAARRRPQGGGHRPRRT